MVHQCFFPLAAQKNDSFLTICLLYLLRVEVEQIYNLRTSPLKQPLVPFWTPTGKKIFCQYISLCLLEGWTRLNRNKFEYPIAYLGLALLLWQMSAIKERESVSVWTTNHILVLTLIIIFQISTLQSVCINKMGFCNFFLGGIRFLD